MAKTPRKPAVAKAKPAKKVSSGTLRAKVAAPKASSAGTDSIPTGKDGIAGGSVGAGNRLPGTGGSAAAQAQPAATTGLPADPRGKSSGGDAAKTVDSDYFSRERKLRDLADPNAALQRAGGGGVPALGKSAGDLLAGAGAIPSADAGKNKVSKQDQQGTTFRVDAERDASTVVQQSAGLQEARAAAESAAAAAAAKAAAEAYEKAYRDSIYAWEEKARKEQGGGKKRPTPDGDDGGATGAPPIATTQPAGKTPAQTKAERKRQVTLPGENPRDLEMVRPKDAKAAFGSGKQGGAIDPPRDGETPSGGASPPVHGPDADGGPRGPGVPGTSGKGPARPGSSPDNPTASGNEP